MKKNVQYEVKQLDQFSSLESTRDDKGKTVQDGFAIKDKVKPAGFELKPYILLNLMNFFYSCSSRFEYTDQYLYQYYSEPYADILNKTINTASNPCFEHNSTSNGSSPEKDIQKQASEMHLYLNMTRSILGLVSVVILGALAAVMNRRVLLLIPLVGHFVRNGMTALVVFFNLDPNWMFVGYVFDGCSSTWPGMYFALMMYLTEITPRNKSRTLALAILESLKGALTSSLSIAKGHLIQYAGYTTPAAINTSLMFAAIMVACMLPDKRPKVEPTSAEYESKTPLIRRFWNKLKVPFVSNETQGATSIIVLGGLAQFFGTIGVLTYVGSDTLYFMHKPFCWSQSHLGWFMAANNFSDDIVNIVFIGLFTKYLKGGVTLGIPLIMLAGIGKIVYGSATSDIWLYMAAVLGMGGNISSILLRGETSRVLGPKAQGPWFAVVAVIMSASFALGTPAVALYRYSLDINLPGLVFFVAAGWYFLKALTLTVYQVKWRRYAALQSKEVLEGEGADVTKAEPSKE